MKGVGFEPLGKAGEKSYYKFFDQYKLVCRTILKTYTSTPIYLYMKKMAWGWICTMKNRNEYSFSIIQFAITVYIIRDQVYFFFNNSPKELAIF